MSDAQTLVFGTATAAAQARFPDPQPISIIRNSRPGASFDSVRQQVDAQEALTPKDEAQGSPRCPPGGPCQGQLTAILRF